MHRVKLVQMGRARHKLGELNSDKVGLAEAHKVVRIRAGPEIDGEGLMPAPLGAPLSHHVAIQEHAHEAVIEQSKPAESQRERLALGGCGNRHRRAGPR